MKRIILFIISCLFITLDLLAQNSVVDSTMKRIYDEIKTPYKYGLIVVPADNSKKIDCPSVFRKGNTWYMTYIQFDGRGYETWLSESKDLLHWKSLGRIMSFSDTTQWDTNQKAGYIGLQDPTWGGSYALQSFNHKYWLSYFGGKDRGYEETMEAIRSAFNRPGRGIIRKALA